MSDFLSDTPDLSRSYCPVCEPDADPIREILHTNYCYQHKPTITGEADHEVGSTSTPLGLGESEAETNRLFAEFFRSR